LSRLRYKEHLLNDVIRELQYDNDGHHAEDQAADPHFKIGSKTHTAEMWLKDSTTGKGAAYHIKTSFNEPVDRILTLFNEIDLYPNWLPFVWEATRLHLVRGCGDHAQFIVFLKYALPWPIKSREAILYGFASDRIEKGQVLVCAKSIPQGTTEWWGYSIPPGGSSIRIDLSFKLGFVPHGKDYTETRMDMIIEIDPKIDWLSKKTVNYIGRQFVTQMSNNIASICRRFDKSPYPARLKADESGAYRIMYECLSAFRRGQLPEETGVL